MNKRQRNAIEQVSAKLKKPRCGASIGGPLESEAINAALALLEARGYVVTSRLYLDTWVTPALDLALSALAHEQQLAERISA